MSGYTNEAPDQVEVFPGVGFFSRPRAGTGEAIILKVGTSHPVVVATRDEQTRVELDADETAIFNSTGALIKITKDGDVFVHAKSGREVFIDDGSGAQALATKADVDSLASWAKGHVHAGIGSVGEHPVITTFPQADGTAVLRAK